MPLNEASAARTTKRTTADASGDQPARERIWSRSFLTIFAISMVANIAQFATVAVIPVYAASLGAAPFLVGIATGAFAATALAARPFIGPTTLRFPGRRLLVFALALIATAFVLYATVGHEIVLLIVGRFVQGLGMGVLPPVALALVADALPPRRLASGVGVFSMSQALAMAAGPALGLAAIDLIGYSATFLVNAVLAVVAACLALTLPAPRQFQPAPFRLSFHNMFAREAVTPAVVMFLTTSAFAVIQTFVVIYAGIRSIPEPWMFFAVYAVSLLVARPAAGRLADRLGATWVVMTSLALFMGAVVVLALASSLPSMIAAAVLMGFGYGAAHPMLQSIALGATPRERRAIAGNTLYFGIDIAYLTMPAVGGAVVTALSGAGGLSEPQSYSALLLGLTIPIVVAAITFVASRRSPR